MGDFLSPINLGQAVLQISAGEKHTCAVLLDQSLKCWGKNSEGQLGRLDQAWQISRCIAHVFLRVYNGISGVVLRFHGLPSVMCCTFRFAGLGISLRRSLS